MKKKKLPGAPYTPTTLFRFRADGGRLPDKCGIDLAHARQGQTDLGTVVCARVSVQRVSLEIDGLEPGLVGQLLLDLVEAGQQVVAGPELLQGRHVLEPG